MPAKKKADPDAPVDPNKLVRARAGIYRTSDERFEVRQAALGWFLIDSSATDELGQELTRGPFPTLAAIGEQLPEARRTTIKPLPRPKAAKTTPAVTSARGTAAKTPTKAAPKQPAKPPSWIESLPDREAADVKRLIRALELEEIPDAEALVRTARKSADPVLATRILERRLAALVDDIPGGDRAAAARVVQRVAELLTSDGTKLFNPLPGWALVEVEPGKKPERRIVVRPPSKRR